MYFARADGVALAEVRVKFRPVDASLDTAGGVRYFASGGRSSSGVFG